MLFVPFGVNGAFFNEVFLFATIENTCWVKWLFYTWHIYIIVELLFLKTLFGWITPMDSVFHFVWFYEVSDVKNYCYSIYLMCTSVAHPLFALLVYFITCIK